jgi:hypothetical protein
MRTERKRSDRFIDHLRKRVRRHHVDVIARRTGCVKGMLGTAPISSSSGSRPDGPLGSPLRVATRRCTD